MRKIILGVLLTLAAVGLVAIVVVGIGEINGRQVQAAAISKSVQLAATAVITPTFTVITSTDGISFINDGRIIAYVKNAYTDTITLTVRTNFSVGGLALPDQVTAIPVGEERITGPFAPLYFNQAGTDSGRVVIKSSSLVSVSVALITMP